MGHRRLHVVIPDELAREIDRLVGQRRRSQFLTQAAERELRRLRMLKALEYAAGFLEGRRSPGAEAGRGAVGGKTPQAGGAPLPQGRLALMATYLLDSSVLIDALLGKRGRHTLLKDLLLQGHLLACCPINVAEIYVGMRPKEEAATGRFLKGLEYFDVSWEVARRAGLLKGEYARKGVTLTLADAIIAAVALSYRLPLVTDTVKHFSMKDLKLYPLPKT